MAAYLVSSADLHVHHDDFFAAARERLVQRAQQLGDARIVGADHHAVGTHEVFDRRAFLEEFRVRNHVEFDLGAALRERFGDRRAHLVGGADRHRGLGDDHLVFGHVLADGPRHRQHVLEIRRAVFVGRRAHRDELQLAMRHALGRRGGEPQAFGIGIGLDERIETGLMDGNFAPLEAFDLLGVDVDAQHVIAGIGKAGAGDQTDVTGSEYGDSHVFLTYARMGARRGILTNSPYKSGRERL